MNRRITSIFLKQRLCFLLHALVWTQERKKKRGSQKDEDKKKRAKKSKNEKVMMDIPNYHNITKQK
jgi:hypothetical protein